MATDDSDASESGTDGDAGPDASPAGASSGAGEGTGARVGEYTWADFMEEHGHGSEVDSLYADAGGGGGLLGRSGSAGPSGDDWDRVSFDPASYLGFHPDDVADLIREDDATALVYGTYQAHVDPSNVPVAKDQYSWEHFKWEYYYDDEGEPPRDGNGDQEPFDGAEYLGFDPDDTEGVLSNAGNVGSALADVVDDRTVTTIDRFDEDDRKAMPDVTEEDVEAFDEDDFFSDEYGNTTVVNRYDLEKAVPREKKRHFLEENRYWVNKPYAFVIIFHSVKENEKKYYVVEPHTNEIETDLKEFLTGKLRNAIKYSDEDVVVEGSEGDRAAVIEQETRRLLRRYGLVSKDSTESSEGGLLAEFKRLLGGGDEEEATEEEPSGLGGIEVRPEPVVLAEDPDTVNEYQIEKLLYYLKRDFIGYERIDPIKQDTVNVEDVSCDGYNSPVFVYHSDYEQIITNVYHGKEELDDFVVKLAQRSGKGISKRRPQVDATLPDGSRAQLTLGAEVSDHGTNYTIRQFQEVPFTPIDQVSWNTLSLEETAFLWLAIENHKSMLIAGGTATGKTTLLNALSLFIPSNAKIVSIEDTREVELPQRNWIASVTRPSFGEGGTGDVDEFDLLEAALRQRPDYIVMGEVRGEEGRDLFQVMSTGHTSYATFHADSVGEVLKRFTTDPINVSKTMFTALDLVAIQRRTRVGGHSVVRNSTLTEINHYDAENDEINVQDVYQWQAETDEFLKMGESNTIEEIMFDQGWNYDRLQDELFRREVILAYLIHNGLNTYTQVAATIQAFINDPDTILTLVASNRLQQSLEDLREMESVLIEVDPEKEEMAPRPAPSEETDRLCLDILDRAEDSLFEEYRGKEAKGLTSALEDVEPEPRPGELELPGEDDDIEFSGELSEDAFDGDELAVENESLPAGGDAEATPALADAGEDDSPTTAEATAGDRTADDPAGPPVEASTDATASAGSEADASTDDASADAGTAESNAGGLAGGADAADDDGPGWLFGDDEAKLFGGRDDDEAEEEPDLSLSFEAPGEDGGTSKDDGGGGLAFGPPSDGESGSADGAAGRSGGEFDRDDGEASGPDGESGGLAFGDEDDGEDGGFAFQEDDEDEESGGLAFGEGAIEDGGNAPDAGSDEGGFGGFEGVNSDDDGDSDEREEGA